MVLARRSRPVDAPDDVDALALGPPTGASGRKRERLLVRLAKGLNARRLEAVDDKCASLGAARRLHLPAFHIVRGQNLEIPQQLRRVNDRTLDRRRLRQRRGDGQADENTHTRAHPHRSFDGDVAIRRATLRTRSTILGGGHAPDPSVFSAVLVSMTCQ